MLQGAPRADAGLSGFQASAKEGDRAAHIHTCAGCVHTPPPGPQTPQPANSPLYSTPAPWHGMAPPPTKAGATSKTITILTILKSRNFMGRATSPAAQGSDTPHPLKGTKCFIISTGPLKVAIGLVSPPLHLCPLTPSLLLLRIMPTPGLGCPPPSPPKASQSGPGLAYTL